ncbi:hypothetical protein TWF281_005054 [Arthrobotrys megalospora]
MAGIKCTSKVSEAFETMKGTTDLRYITFGFVEKNQKLEIDVRSTGPYDRTFEDVAHELLAAAKARQGSYALYLYESETKPAELVLIKWAPDSIPVDQKMLLDSSIGSLKEALAGVNTSLEFRHELELCPEILAMKIGY